MFRKFRPGPLSICGLFLRLVKVDVQGANGRSIEAHESVALEDGRRQMLVVQHAAPPRIVRWPS